MKKLLVLTTLIFSTVMFSSTSFAEWKKVEEGLESGNTIYADFDRVRKHDGYVYYWELTDYLEPRRGTLSVISYQQGDCNLYRVKVLGVFFHNEPMGGGTRESFTPPEEWLYPPPNSTMGSMLKLVCSR